MATGHTLFAAPGMVYRCGGHKIVTIEETIDNFISRLATYDVAQCKYCTRDRYEITRHAHEDHAWEDDKAWKTDISQVLTNVGERLRKEYVEEKAAARKAHKIAVAKKAEELAQTAN